MLIHCLKGSGQITGFLTGTDGLYKHRRKQLAATFLEAGGHTAACLYILSHLF